MVSALHPEGRAAERAAGREAEKAAESRAGKEAAAGREAAVAGMRRNPTQTDRIHCQTRHCPTMHNG